MKAVIVEDNPVDSRLLCAVMESEGHRVITCTCVGDGLHQVLAHQPDVVLVDLNLPDIDGLELIRAIRAHQQARAVPVLAMTAYPHRYISCQAFDAGCSAWLVKPLNTRNLIAQLLVLCAKVESSG